MNRTGFDSQIYLREQTEAIRRRLSLFPDKLYLEFGGKILNDFHAARVLPGYDPNIKIKLLQELRDRIDIILCIYAGDIERRQQRSDYGITYDADTLKLIDELGDRGLKVTAVVITRYEEQASARVFKNKLERQGIRVYTHRFTRGYPTDVEVIVSEEGYGANQFIETTRPLVIVSGPGPGSGKLATCLSQLYHEHKRGIRAGYAKFETFPIWDLPLKHPVNVAYEAATADLGDFNLVDPFHLEAYNQRAINYNRDVEAFPLLKRILSRIAGNGFVYKSPTDMGVNVVSRGITDDEVVKEAARQEIIRRYFRYHCEYVLGFTEQATLEKAELLMKELNLRPEDRVVVPLARAAAVEAQQKGKGNNGVYVGAALELRDGRTVKGYNSPLMHAASSAVLNALKQLAGIPEYIHLLSPSVLEQAAYLKQNIFGGKALSLDLTEVLTCLAITAPNSPATQLALDKLKELKGCEMHLTHMPTPGDETGLRRLGINLTSDPVFASKNLFPG
ncbi:MAG: DUF1846 domain-containing protein [Candidatus Aminicenantes bacterium]|nr:DUF1846 domain-containing protein [Candidatus Aminicenantes bacterium]